VITKVKNNTFQNLIISATVITLVLFPYISKDSLVMPKIILLFLLSLYLLPNLIYDYKNFIKFSKFKIILAIALLTLFQLLISFAASDAPFEQQFYGRTGRGFGIITHFSMLVVLVAAAVYIRQLGIRLLLIALTVSGVVTSTYSVFQSFGIDFLKWESRTNGVIGTLGNPNFQASFAAMVFIPAMVAIRHTKFKHLVSLMILTILLVALVRTQSIQGYVSLILAVSTFIIIFLWYQNKVISILLFFTSFCLGIVAILGMLNYGPLSEYLYKASVQSRGDFWRSAFSVSRDFPLTGVGLDSFGDYFLMYRDQVAANHSFAEYTDNAHNIYLELTAVGGYPLSLLYLLLVIFVLYSYITTQRNIQKFNPELAALFTAWLVYQAQSVISPGNIAMTLWNAIISGSLVGYCVLSLNSIDQIIPESRFRSITRPFSTLLIVFGLIISYPLFNTDRLQMKAMTTGDGDLAITSAQRFPESVLRYTVISRALLDSSLPGPALSVAKSAVKFNPNSANLWALILINPSATKEERLFAKSKILKLDPLNKEVLNYNVF
jgi:O-antigen ligase